jgi:histone-lysine N-methyltransferase SETD7
METVLVGRFEKGQMIAAKQSKIVGERCNRGIKEIRTAKPKDERPTFRYQRPDRLRICDQPRVMDPYERKNIYIGDGRKQDGVFAKRNIAKGDLVMYYSGLFWNETEQALYTKDTYHNQTWEEYWSIFRNLLEFDGTVVKHVPEPYWNISNYRATLGHKLNHSFKYAKTDFGKAFHPRFGDIRSIFATADITKGEEILLDYGYGQNTGLNAPLWVSELYLKETGKKWYS